MVEGDIPTDAVLRLTRRGVARVAAAALVATGIGVTRLGRVAAATTVAECQGKIAALVGITQNARITGQNAVKDRTGLIGKLGSASRKLDEGKFVGAIQALTDFSNKVGELNAAGKIHPTDAAALIAGADEAITGIRELPAAE